MSRPLVLLVVVLLGAAVPPACAGGAPRSEVVGGIRTINAAQLKAEREAGTATVVLDVRTPAEYASGHVPGAINIPIDQLDGRLGELEAHKAGEIHVICEVGGRSLAASQSLLARGYRPVNVDGGTRAWRSAGFPTE